MNETEISHQFARRVGDIVAAIPQKSFAQVEQELLQNCDQYCMKVSSDLALELRRRTAEWVFNAAIFSEASPATVADRFRNIEQLGFTDVQKQLSYTCSYSDFLFEEVQERSAAIELLSACLSSLEGKAPESELRCVRDRIERFTADLRA